MHFELINHWLEGTKENRMLLYYIAEHAMEHGKSAAEFPMLDAFRNIIAKSYSQKSFQDEIDKEHNKLTSFREEKVTNPFSMLETPVTKAILAEKFARAHLSASSHEEAAVILKAVANGNAWYFDLVSGVSYSYRSWVLQWLRKEGFRFWQTHKNQFQDFINNKITFREIRIVKPGLPSGENDADKVKIQKRSFFNNEVAGIKYQGFVCKSHVTQEQLDSLDLYLIRNGYLRRAKIDSLSEEAAKLTQFHFPAIWTEGLGRLAYLFTRLAETILILPDDLEVPENALVYEPNLSLMDKKLKKAQMQAFSEWLNKELVKNFRHENGEQITSTQLNNGRKNIMKQINDEAKWKGELDDVLQLNNLS